MGIAMVHLLDCYLEFLFWWSEWRMRVFVLAVFPARLGLNWIEGRDGESYMEMRSYWCFLSSSGVWYEGLECSCIGRGMEGA